MVHDKMIPVGYMAKHVVKTPVNFKMPRVTDIYSVSNCNSDDFADYINFWKHNRYWLFDSPQVICTLAKEQEISLECISLFYYESYELQFDGESWTPFEADLSIEMTVDVPAAKTLRGFDVVTFRAGNAPECSPLSCNGLAEELPTNSHCLLNTLEEAKRYLDEGAFQKCEPGPYRIFGVYSVDWP